MGGAGGGAGQVSEEDLEPGRRGARSSKPHDQPRRELINLGVVHSTKEGQERFSRMISRGIKVIKLGPQVRWIPYSV